FAVATVNVGTGGGTITAYADTGGVILPVMLAICATNPATGACLMPPASSVTIPINPGATPTFAVFVTGQGAVAFDPAVNRILVRFTDNSGTVRGGTNVGVLTQ